MRNPGSNLFVSLLLTYSLHYESVFGENFFTYPFVFMENGVSATSGVNQTIHVINPHEVPAFSLTVVSSDWKPAESEFLLDKSRVDISIPSYLSLNGTEKSDKVLYLNISRIFPAVLSAEWPSVYLSVNGEEASDSTFILPDSSLGAEYYAVTYCEIFGRCQIAITLDSFTREATITIKLPSTYNVRVEYNGDNYTSGQVINAVLSTNNAVQIQCDCDLTGTYIRSENNVNIAVFAGSIRAILGKGGRRDFLTEQMLPVASWDKEYMVYANPLSKIGDFIRIVTCRDNTIIKISGYNTTKLNKAGEYIHRRIDSGRGVYICANKPIMVVQFTLNTEFADWTNVDSSMFLVQPYTQYTNMYVLDTLTEDSKSNSYLTVFMQQGKGEQYFFLDDHFINKHTSALATTIIPEKSILITIMEVNPGKHVIYSNETFGVYLFTETQGHVNSHLIGITSNAQTLKLKPMVPGDQVDNDNDGEIDEDESCDENDLLKADSGTGRDCSKVEGDSSYWGMKFLLVFPNRDSWNGTTTFDVTINSTSWDSHSLNYVVRPGNSIHQEFTINVFSYNYTHINISDEDVEIYDADISDQTVLIEAEKNVIIHAHHESQGSSYSYLPLPVNAFGLDYFAVTHRKDITINRNLIAIAAAYSGTLVSIHLPDLHGEKIFIENNYYGDNEVVKVNLQQFQVFLIRQFVDLTGTYIHASNPVAVYSGADDYFEQLFPVEYFGKHFVLPKLPTDILMGLLRIVASEGITTCEITEDGLKKSYYNLWNAGEFVDREIYNFDPIYTIDCRKPVQVTLFTDYTAFPGFMTNVAPVELYTTKYLFTTPPVVDKEHFYISVQRGYIHFSVNLKSYFPTLSSNFETKVVRSNETLLHLTERGVQNQLTTDYQNEDFAAYMFVINDSTGPASGTLLGMNLRILSQTCTPSDSSVADGLDNDCDGLSDEDVCVREIYQCDPTDYITSSVYIKDFDVDGSIDEDCEYEVLITNLSDYTSPEVTTKSPDSTSEMIEQSSDSTSEVKNQSSDSNSEVMKQSLDSTSEVIKQSSDSTIDLTTQKSDSAPKVQNQPQVLSCRCPCSSEQSQNLTKEQIEQWIEDIKRELIVEKSNLSSQIRKKTSAEDSRPSACGVGSFGIIMLCCSLGLLILSDFNLIMLQIRMLTENMLAIWFFK